MYGYQGGKGRGKNWQIGIDTHTLLILRLKQITNENQCTVQKSTDFGFRFPVLSSLLYDFRLHNPHQVILSLCLLLPTSEEELKSLLLKVKEESEKAGLKLNIPKTKIMASGPITSWEIDGETM